MQTMRTHPAIRKAFAFLMALFLIAGTICIDPYDAEAKGSLSTEDYAKNVLVYAENSAGEEILIAQLSVSDLLSYLNSNIATYGKVHNYSVLDSYVTPVHQEAQGFSMNDMLDYAKSKSTLDNINSLGLTFSGTDSIRFWEMDDTAFDAADTYTYNSLYGVNRYNFPAMYANWNYTTKAYSSSGAIWASREEEVPLLSITAYSQRYMASSLYGTDDYNMENYFDSHSLLDTAKTVRLMLPMTQAEFAGQKATAGNSRYAICYILYDMASDPTFSLGEVEKPTCTVIDGDESTTDSYDAGYWYFTLSCATEGATIYYNDNSVNTYMPTAKYTSGQKIKVAKSGVAAGSLSIRAVKDGYSDAGIVTVSSSVLTDSYEEEPPANASVWDGSSSDISWYDASKNTFTISTASQLAGLQTLVSGENATAGAVTFADKTITLGNNIYLAAHKWEPIGTDTNNSQYHSFKGTFDGNGFGISGVAVNDSAANCYAGLFAKTENATISDLAVSGCVIGSHAAGIGMIAGTSVDSTIQNCSAKGKLRSYSNAGGIAGYTSGGTISDCINYTAITSSVNTGGIVGNAASTAMKSCINNGNLNCDISCAGGIVGNNASTGPTDCVNNGTIAGISPCINVGGIAGASFVKSSNCRNYGEISGYRFVGGISGFGDADNCANYGTVTGTYYGAIGGISGSGSAFTSCVNVGTVNGSSGVSSTSGHNGYAGVGGIAGTISGTVTGCANFGAVTGYQYFGGLVGYIDTSSNGNCSRIDSSYNRGSYTLKSSGMTPIYCGGLVGYVGGGADANYQNTVSNCYDAGGGAVFGEVNTNTILTNDYYLTGGTELNVDPTANRLGLDAKTDTQMKASAFVTTLHKYNASGNGTTDGYFISDANNYPALYWQTATISFDLTPSTAAAAVTNSSGTAISANANGTYTLIIGQTYSYTAAGTGYISDSGSFTVTGPKTIALELAGDKIATSGPNQIVLSWSGKPDSTQSVVLVR